MADADEPLLLPHPRLPGRWVLQLHVVDVDAAVTPMRDWLAGPGETVVLRTEPDGSTYDGTRLAGVALEAARLLERAVGRSARRRALGPRDLMGMAAAAQNLSIIAAEVVDAEGPGIAALTLAQRLLAELSVAVDRRFVPHDDHTFTTYWTPTDQLLLDRLAAELADELGSGSDDQARLFPPAYGEDQERSRGYAALADDELIAARREALATLRGALERDRATAEEMAAMMRAVNALRLVLGTRLGVTEERHEVSDDDPDAPSWAVYHHLTHLLGQIIAALRHAPD